MNEVETQPEIGIAEPDRQAVAAMLKSLLADEFVLYVKTRNFHWNVMGANFSELHAFFERQYAVLDEIIDDVAERIRALGVVSPGSMRELLAAARLKEVPSQALPAETMVELLLEDHERLVRNLRKDVAACVERHNDAGTSDFLTGLMEKHEKAAWMLRSH
ncbi:MAG: Dps family protein [Elusimicrobiota bacterium]